MAISDGTRRNERADILELLSVPLCQFRRVVPPEVVVLVWRRPRQVSRRQLRLVLVVGSVGVRKNTELSASMDLTEGKWLVNSR